MKLTNERERQAYDTHFNYVECLFDLTRGATIKYNGGLKKATLPFLKEKKNLISLTKKSLNDEYKIVQIDKEYSYASTSWLPIKSYYLIFNVLLSIEYIFKLQKGIYNTGHISCIDEFTRKLSSGEISFSQPILNQVFDKSILTYKITSGANLSRRTNIADRYKMVLRKIAWYKEEDWKRKNNINLHKAPHKMKHYSYLNSFAVSIFDFPYCMRIRSNYRDFAFIDGIDTSETAEYFKKYFGFTAHFVEALDRMENNLVALRTGV